MNKNKKNAVRKEKKILKEFDNIRIDNYFWLNQRDNPEVIDYLKEENEYYRNMTSHTFSFQEKLFQEMKSRIKEDESSPPYFFNDYWYITRFEKDKNYPIYSRKYKSLEADEEILFDCNVMSEGLSFFNLTGINVSHNNRYIAFAIDSLGRRIYSLYIKDTYTGEIMEEEISNCAGDSAWANDNKTLFYTKIDSKTLRSDKIYKHIIGQDSSLDTLVFKEKDQTFDLCVYRDKAMKYIFVCIANTITSEYRYMEADNVKDKFEIFQSRKRGLEYDLYYFNSNFYILTNKDKAVNFKLMKCSESNTSHSNWIDLIPHRDQVLLEDVDIFKDYFVLSEKNQGLNQIRVISWDGKIDYYLPFSIDTYTANTSINTNFDTSKLRYVYESLSTPSMVCEFDMRTKQTFIIKQQEVLGGSFNIENYIEERIWAKADDGTKVPISLVYRKDIIKNGKNPLLLYAYGSYGISIEPDFSTTRLSLLDRGFIFAIAHVRGGEDLGRKWYEQGRLLNKKNTFGDFISCSKYLIEQKYTNHSHLYAMGGSAGGMLMGVVANTNPELYRGIISLVPFVDIVTTMLDETIPLTTGEYDEWGNPNHREYYDYMLSYSPYDNVKKQNYPNIYVSAGLHDSQVQYWEPAKWVAKLRDMKTDDNLLFLDTNMKAGHSGASGRYDSLREIAKEFSFLFDLEDIKE